MAILPAYVQRTGLEGGDLGFSVAWGAGASFSFSTDRGDARNPVVGDSWHVFLTAINSHALVTRRKSKPDGSVSTDIMGRTDEYGNFGSIGQFTSSDLGSWVEDWSVGGVHVGTWSYTVHMPSGAERKLAPAQLLTPMPSIINPRAGEVSSADMGAGCQISSWVSQNPLMAVAVAIGVGVVLRRM